jgi:hypothetical protein
MRTRFLLMAFLTVLAASGRLTGSEEEFLPWTEVRIVGAEREDSGLVVFSAKTKGDEYLEVKIDSFGKQFALAKEDLQKLSGMPLNSLVITHEGGFALTGGHMVHFKLKKVHVDAAGQVIERKALVSVSRGLGLSVGEPKDQIVSGAK